MYSFNSLDNIDAVGIFDLECPNLAIFEDYLKPAGINMLFWFQCVLN